MNQSLCPGAFRALTVVLASLLLSVTASAQLTVVSVQPAINASNVLPNADVVVTFDRAIAASALPPSTDDLKVFGKSTGPAAGAWSLGPGGLSARFTPAVPHGLTPAQALRSVTLSSAEFLGIDDHVGSLDKGKHATLFVADGDPFELGTKIEHAFVQGRKISLTDKQTALDAKYREKYRQRGTLKRD